AELMDPTYQARAFFGGPDGPNYPSPRGLLDIPGWEQLDKGEAAQAVEVSAYPDRYRNYEPVAETILTTLTGATTTIVDAAPAGAAPHPTVRRSWPPPTAPSPSRSSAVVTAASSSSRTPSPARRSRRRTGTCGRPAFTYLPVTR